MADCTGHQGDNVLGGIMTYEIANKLIGTKGEEYQPPKFPFELPNFNETLIFGAEARKHFYIDMKNWNFLNHGAFGGALKEAIDVAHQWQIHIEKQPVKFVDRELIPHMVYIIRRLAGFMSCDPRDLVLVPNATEGIDTVLRSLTFRKGEKVLYLNTCYYAVKKHLKHLNAEYGVLLQEVSIPFPSTKEEILNIIQQALEPDTKIALFGHIPSVIPIILPVKEMIDICHNKGVQVLIDGAHALGSVLLNLSDLKADYYVTNAHKWLCAPKGCAALYVDSKHQSSIRCLTVSGGFDKGFTAQFIFRGLRDYSSFLALHTVLDFWCTVGPEKIQSHNTRLAHQAGQLLASRWNTETLFPLHMFGSMVLIRLPDILWQSQITAEKTTVDKPMAEAVQAKVHSMFSIEVPIKAVEGRLYVRISAHIYNELEQYEELADAVLKLTGLCT